MSEREVAFLDLHIAKVDIFVRDTIDDGDRRIEPHRLLDYLLVESQLVDHGGIDWPVAANVQHFA